MSNVADETRPSEADRLSEALRSGGWLEPRPIEGVPLEPDEAAYADLHATGWRYFGLDSVVYERRSVLAGGPYLMALTALASAIGNRRRRRAARQLATPQWRPLGPLRVVVTSERLLVWHGRAWWPVWYATVSDLRLDRSQEALDLFFDVDPAYRLMGPGVAAVGVVLRSRLFAESADRAAPGACVPAPLPE